jgi:AcrR family transcriptional regulator
MVIGRRPELGNTRDRLIEAARTLMIERGVLGVSLVDITERAEANVALVSYHFKGREGLMLAVAKADAEIALENLDKLIAADLSASEKISHHIAGIIRTYATRPYLHRLLQQFLREGTREAAAQVASFFTRPVAEARRQILEAGMATGEFRQVDPLMVGFALEGACAHIFTSAEARAAVLGDGTLDDALVDRHAKSTAALFVAGLRA